MQFLLHIEVTWPPDGDPGEKDRRIAAEASRARELAAEGVIKRLWRIPGQWANMGPLGGGRRDGPSRGRSRRCRCGRTSMSRSSPWPTIPTTRGPADERADRGRPDHPGRLRRHLFDLAGRVAVVTGGGSGLGRAIAIGYAQAGVHGRRRRRQRRRRRGDRRGHRRARAARAARPPRRHRQARRCDAARRLGRRDVTAGSTSWSTAPARRSARPPRSSPRRSSTSSSTSTSRAPTCAARRSGGRCSPRARAASSTSPRSAPSSAYPWASAYLASKGGVLGITRGLALEWRDRGVRVNGIGPTLMDSPLTRQAAQRHRSRPTSSRPACCGRGWACRASSSGRPSSSPATPRSS